MATELVRNAELLWGMTALEDGAQPQPGTLTDVLDLPQPFWPIQPGAEVAAQRVEDSARAAIMDGEVADVHVGEPGEGGAGGKASAVRKPDILGNIGYEVFPYVVDRRKVTPDGQPRVYARPIATDVEQWQRWNGKVGGTSMAELCV